VRREEERSRRTNTYNDHGEGAVPIGRGKLFLQLIGSDSPIDVAPNPPLGGVVCGHLLQFEMDDLDVVPVLDTGFLADQMANLSNCSNRHNCHA
jgi:hypothetical protein